MSEVEFYSQLTNLEVSLMKFAFRLTQKKEEAKDLYQETCLHVLINRNKFLYDDNLKAWIFTIMKNTFINDYRKSFRQKNIIYQADDAIVFNQEEPSLANNPDSIFYYTEISQAIEQLEIKLRVPFKMHLQGYKYKEIAESLNLKIGTVKSRIFFSRKQLMSKIER
jgi:RNA polymerase sigma-70 factor (ECF subfamily)